MPFLLSIAVVSCWTLTWYAIKLHLGVVPLPVSLFYRMSLAAVFFGIFCVVRKKNLRYSLKDHFFFALQGLFNFCLNYLFAYAASQYLASGVNAVVFSFILPLNILNSALFFKERFTLSFLAIATLSLGGLAWVFWPDLSSLDFSNAQLTGLFLGLMGSLFASFGNMIATRNQRRELPIIQSNTFGLLYGALFCLVYIVFTKEPFVWDSSPLYAGIILYLALIGTVAAFSFYFKLVQLIGPARAAYPLLLVPVAALLVSQVFEGFQWDFHSTLGVGIIILANTLISYQKNRSLGQPK